MGTYFKTLETHLHNPRLTMIPPQPRRKITAQHFFSFKGMNFSSLLNRICSSVVTVATDQTDLKACLYVIKKNEGAALRVGSPEREIVLLSLVRQLRGTCAD